jgi:hypothetical protein
MKGDAHMQWNVEYVMCHTIVPMGKWANKQWRDDPFLHNHRNSSYKHPPVKWCWPIWHWGPLLLDSQPGWHHQCKPLVSKSSKAETKNKTNCLGKLTDIIILLPIPTRATQFQDQLNAMLWWEVLSHNAPQPGLATMQFSHFWNITERGCKFMWDDVQDAVA